MIWTIQLQPRLCSVTPENPVFISLSRSISIFYEDIFPNTMNLVTTKIISLLILIWSWPILPLNVCRQRVRILFTLWMTTWYQERGCSKFCLMWQALTSTTTLFLAALGGYSHSDKKTLPFQATASLDPKKQAFTCLILHTILLWIESCKWISCQAHGSCLPTWSKLSSLKHLSLSGLVKTSISGKL